MTRKLPARRSNSAGGGGRRRHPRGHALEPKPAVDGGLTPRQAGAVRLLASVPELRTLRRHGACASRGDRRQEPGRPGTPPARNELQAIRAHRSRRVTRRDVSHYTHLTYRMNLRCVITECAPDAGSLQRFSFLPGKLAYRGRSKDGKAAPSVPLDWPAIVVLSRIDPIDLQRRARGIGRGNRQINVQPLPPWRVDSQLVPVSYDVRPNTAFWASVVGALLLIGAATFLVRSLSPRAGVRETRPARAAAARAGNRSRGERPRVGRRGTRTQGARAAGYRADA